MAYNAPDYGLPCCRLALRQWLRWVAKLTHMGELGALHGAWHSCIMMVEVDMKVVAGPAVATDSFTPDYPREMMAAHQGCRGCWEVIQVGDCVYELEDGNAVHSLCLPLVPGASKMVVKD